MAFKSIFTGGCAFWVVTGGARSARQASGSDSCSGVRSWHLPHVAVRQARPTGKGCTLPDFDGLSLAVSATGGRSWHFRYYWAAKQKRMSLDTYPAVSLREARALRDETRALLAKGINPEIDPKQKLRAVRLATENSFKAVYLQWFAHRRLELKEGRRARCRRSSASSIKTCCLPWALCPFTTSVVPIYWQCLLASSSVGHSRLRRRYAPGFGSCSASSW